MMQRKNSSPASAILMAPRHDWNALGRHLLPPWFPKYLKRIDPTLVLQYVPPDTVDPDGGMDSRRYASGGWQICRKMPRTGWLHKVVVWSLIDRWGRPAPPGPDTIRLLRMARNLWRHHQYTKLESELEDKIRIINRNKATASRDQLQKSLQECLSIMGHRQFTNRVFVRNDKMQKQLGV